MQQRQPRLGDILDDYCPRERRLTNHAVVAMIGEDIRLTRCTTCDAEHDYKHARVPRAKKKADFTMPAAVGVPVPRRIVPEHVVTPTVIENVSVAPVVEPAGEPTFEAPTHAAAPAFFGEDSIDAEDPSDPPPPRLDEGPVHRQLIRAQLPREGQPASPRQAPDFTIRQPGGRPNRFRGRQSHGGFGFSGGYSSQNGNGNRSHGPNGHGRGGQRPGSRPSQHGNGRKRSK